MQRITWLDSLRGFAMLMVVLGHVSAMSSNAVLWIYAFHMPLFFMISGVVFRYSKYKSLKECVIDKAKKLLLPYVFLFLINFPFWFVNWKILGSSSATPLGMLEGFLTANHAIGYMTSTVLWFLPCLFLVSILFWEFAHLEKIKGIKIEALVFICFILAWALSSYFDSPAVWHWKTVPLATVFYWIGWRFGHVWHAFVDKFSCGKFLPVKNLAYLCLIVLLLVVGTAVAFLNGKISMHANSYHNFALMLTASLALCLGFALLFIKLPEIKLFDFAGKNSITFFGFHIALLRFLEHFPYTEFFAESYPLVLGLIVFLLLVPVSMFVNRFCPYIVGKQKIHRG